MIEIGCCSGDKIEVSEANLSRPIHCPRCGAVLQLVCSEALPEGAGAGDFDAALVADNSSGAPAARYVLGGTTDILIGKSPECTIVLPGKLVSRRHCKLVRVDFGPSRWKIVDNKSTNGLFVNKQRVSEHELHDGGAVQIGEFGFTCHIEPPPVPTLAMASLATPSQPVYHAPPPGANSMATAGMVLGFIFCVPPCSLLAIIFSIIGLSKSKQPGVGGKWQATTGLICGIVGLIFTIIVFVLPGVFRGIEMANRVKSAQNMRQISAALAAYAGANRGNLPPTLDVLVQSGQLPAAAAICPTSTSGTYVLAVRRLARSGNTVILYEPISSSNEGINILYADGSVRFVPTATAQQIIASLPNANAQPFAPWAVGPRPPAVAGSLPHFFGLTAPPNVPQPLAHPSAEEEAAQLQKIAASWRQQGGAQEVLGDMEGFSDAPTPGQPRALRPGLRIRTPKTFKTPVTFQIVLLTNFADTRLIYAFDQIIFNWEMRQDELRVDGGPGGGFHPRDGVGKLPPNQWVGIELTVTPTEAILYVNGQEIDRLPGDYSRIDEPFLLEAHNGPVDVKSIRVVQ